MTQKNSDMLRSRVLAAIGVATLYSFGSVAEGDTGDTGDSAPPPSTACIPWTDATCPTPDEAVTALQESLQVGCELLSVDSEGTLSEDQCCYEVTVRCDTDTGLPGSGPKDCGCYGRPYVDGQVRTASAVPRQDWADPSLPAPSTAGLSEAQRSRLARKWTTDALAEHSSVAGFHRFALDLLAHGAPPELIARAQLAAAEEVGHARLCFALASAFARAPIGPSGIDMGSTAPVARDLVELALSTAQEGCVGETLATLLAAEMRDRASDPAVRQALETISAEEMKHAELAWATLRWALQQGGAPVREALEALRLSPSAAVEEGPEDPALAGWGLLGAEETATVLAEGRRRVVEPALALLLRGPVQPTAPVLR